MPGRDLILLGCGANSTLARSEIFNARLLHEPLPISNQPVGLRFPHCAGRSRPGGAPISSPGCWSIWKAFCPGDVNLSSP